MLGLIWLNLKARFSAYRVHFEQTRVSVNPKARQSTFSLAPFTNEGNRTMNSRVVHTSVARGALFHGTPDSMKKGSRFQRFKMYLISQSFFLKQAKCVQLNQPNKSFGAKCFQLN